MGLLGRYAIWRVNALAMHFRAVDTLINEIARNDPAARADSLRAAGSAPGLALGVWVRIVFYFVVLSSRICCCCCVIYKSLFHDFTLQQPPHSQALAALQGLRCIVVLLIMSI